MEQTIKPNSPAKKNFLAAMKILNIVFLMMAVVWALFVFGTISSYTNKEDINAIFVLFGLFAFTSLFVHDILWINDPVAYEERIKKQKEDDAKNKIAVKRGVYNFFTDDIGGFHLRLADMYIHGIEVKTYLDAVVITISTEKPALFQNDKEELTPVGEALVNHLKMKVDYPIRIYITEFNPFN